MNRDIAEAVEALRDEDGLLRLEKIVEVASDPESILHSRFEWNDPTAAHKFRIEQARSLVRECKIPVRIGPQIIHAPAFVSVPSESANTYRRIDEIEQRSPEAHQVLLDEMTRVSGVLNRARRVALVLDIEDVFSELLVSVAHVVDAVKAKGAAA
jgi:hypothetical protein